MVHELCFSLEATNFWFRSSQFKLLDFISKEFSNDSMHKFANFTLSFVNLEKVYSLVKSTAWFLDDEDIDELFLRNSCPTKGVYVLFPVGTIVRNSHHRKSLTRYEQGLNLRRI